jgi:DedD protein
MSENDAQLELKKRARRRLVGAAALAVLAAVVLPMVMDQAPKQPVQDIQIRIPAQESGTFTSRILPVKPGTLPTPLPSAAAPQESKPAAAEPAKGAAKPEAKTETKPETKPEAKPESKPEAKAEAKAAPKPAPEKVSPAGTASKPPEEKPQAKKAEPAAQAKPAVAVQTPAPAGGEWVVQLGAYKDPANVRNLTAKVKQQGYNFYTEVLPSPDGSSRTRVRAGPFASKEDAEAARERIKRMGVDGVVAQK